MTIDRWDVGRRTLTLDRPRVMGILNVTPDSFSDGGIDPTPEAAIERAIAMVAAGASVIDVGAESTRPGAISIDVAEQLERAVPIIEGIRRIDGEVIISIDTTRQAVAEAALDAGADAVNDVSAGLDDPTMLPMIAARGCGVVLMHRLRAPAEDSYSDAYDEPPRYADVIQAVADALSHRVSAAVELGIQRERIVIDPGLGFGKTVEQNYALVARLGELARLGLPILGASSRKSFIGAVSGESEPLRREPGSIALTVLQAARGVRVFRVHDVAAHAQALAVTEAVCRASKEQPTSGAG